MQSKVVVATARDARLSFRPERECLRQVELVAVEDIPEGCSLCMRYGGDELAAGLLIDYGFIGT